MCWACLSVCLSVFLFSLPVFLYVGVSSLVYVRKTENRREMSRDPSPRGGAHGTDNGTDVGSCALVRCRRLEAPLRAGGERGKYAGDGQAARCLIATHDRSFVGERGVCGGGRVFGTSLRARANRALCCAAALPSSGLDSTVRGAGSRTSCFLLLPLPVGGSPDLGVLLFLTWRDALVFPGSF